MQQTTLQQLPRSVVQAGGQQHPRGCPLRHPRQVQQRNTAQVDPKVAALHTLQQGGKRGSKERCSVAFRCCIAVLPPCVVSGQQPTSRPPPAAPARTAARLLPAVQVCRLPPATCPLLLITPLPPIHSAATAKPHHTPTHALNDDVDEAADAGLFAHGQQCLPGLPTGLGRVPGRPRAQLPPRRARGQTGRCARRWAAAAGGRELLLPCACSFRIAAALTALCCSQILQAVSSSIICSFTSSNLHWLLRRCGLADRRRCRCRR